MSQKLCKMGFNGLLNPVLGILHDITESVAPEDSKYSPCALLCKSELTQVIKKRNRHIPTSPAPGAGEVGPISDRLVGPMSARLTVFLFDPQVIRLADTLTERANCAADGFDIALSSPRMCGVYKAFVLVQEKSPVKVSFTGD